MIVLWAGSAPRGMPCTLPSGSMRCIHWIELLLLAAAGEAGKGPKPQAASRGGSRPVAPSPQPPGSAPQPAPGSAQGDGAQAAPTFSVANVLAEAPVQKLLMVATERLKVTSPECTMCPLCGSVVWEAP